MKTNEVVSALLAIKSLGRSRGGLLEHLNDFLEKRLQAVYSPLSDITNLFFLTQCYDLLSTKIKTKIHKILNERSAYRDIPIFEFILISGSKLKLEQNSNSKNDISRLTIRLLSYNMEELSYKDLAYIEWLYQIFLKKSLKYGDRKDLDFFIQRVRQKYISDVIQAVHSMARVRQQFEEEHELHEFSPILNLLELTLLYEASCHFGKDILVITVSEIDEKFKIIERELFLSKYKWQNMCLFTIFFLLSFICLLLNYGSKLNYVSSILFSALVFVTRYFTAKDNISQIRSFWTNKIFQHFIFILWLSFLFLSVPFEKISVIKNIIPEQYLKIGKVILSILGISIFEFVLKLSNTFFAINMIGLRYNKSSESDNAYN